jgi:radical SAM protein with 4Fe4S-binding SPASM domain
MSGTEGLGPNRHTGDSPEPPEILWIEPTNHCNLKCRLCPSAAMLAEQRCHMPVGEYQRIVRQVRPFCREIWLYGYGESFLHPEIFEMIALTKKQGIRCCISSNFNLETTWMPRILHSGVDVLIVALDGLSQDSYARYRVNGRLDLVKRNVESILELRRRENLRVPHVQLQFLVMAHNEHEIPALEAYVRECGADGYDLKSINLRDYVGCEDMLPSNPHFNRYHDRRSASGRASKCSWPWTSMVINSDGSVAVCCNLAHRRQGTIGNAFDQDVLAIWRGSEYRAIRAAMSGLAELPDMCRNCVSHSISLITPHREWRRFEDV